MNETPETSELDDQIMDTVTTAVNDQHLADAPGQDGLVLLEAEQLLEMTVAELKVYADQRQIDLGAATRKADIVAVLAGLNEMPHFGPVLDTLLQDAGIPLDRVVSRHLKVATSSVAVGWLDRHGTMVGRHVAITSEQAEAIRDELNDFALHGLDTLGDTARANQ